MVKVYKDVTFDLQASKTVVEYGEEFTVTLTASGAGVKEGLEIPYRILSGPSPFGSDIVFIEFSYDETLDYYYLKIILSEDLGANLLTVEQLSGTPVEIEKITDLLYRYKNPLDREETSRSFRATLKSIANTDNLVQGVRAFDFIYSNEYGYFKLDSEFKCTKTFKNKMSLLSPIDRLFKLSLYYMPQYSSDTLFKNNYTSPTPYPDPPTNIKPKLKVEVIKKFVYENEEAEFKISYENIRKGFKINYQYLDTKDTHESSGTFITDDLGYIVIKIPIIKMQVNNSQIRYLKLWLKDYPKINDTVFINVIPQPAYLERFKPGKYIIPLQPFTSYEVTLIGAGGASGASISNRGGNYNVTGDGTGGGDTVVEFETYSCTATGGGGGTSGRWHNGSSFHNGSPGIGGIPNIDSIGTIFVVTKNIKGNNGIYANWSPSVGGASVSNELGDLGYNGAGVNGAWGVGDESLSPGGASGSGGFIVCTIRNDTSRIRNLNLTVGSKGTRFDIGATGTWGNFGADGEHGFAIIKSL